MIDRNARPASRVTPGMRQLLAVAAVAWVAVLAQARPAAACVRASETNRVLGWTADGAYALLGNFDRDGVLEHAEIHPTAYRGHVYLIVDDDEGHVAVTRSKVGECLAWPDDPDANVVDRVKGALTEASLATLPTVKRLGFSKDEVAASIAAPAATAAFTGARRYDAHELALTIGTARVTAPVPVWCVGSCLRDEKWTTWAPKITAIHLLASRAILVEVELGNVCNGGDTTRLVRVDLPPPRAPKLRCTGSGG